MTWFAWIGQGCQWLFGLIAFPFAKLRGPRVLPVIRWTLHILCVLLCVGCLTWLNALWELDKVVRAPLAILRVLWLPLLFVLGYSLAWVGWWLWKTITAPREVSVFPDIDEAWNEALYALDLARVDLATTPLVLLVGGAAETDAGVASAAGEAWDVPLTPRRSDAGVRICASQNVAFVSLARCAASSLYADRLRGAVRTPRQNAAEEGAGGSGEFAGEGGVATLAPPATQRGLALIEQSLALLENENAASLQEESAGEQVALSQCDLELTRKRLTYVCQKLAEVRGARCPVNATLAEIPWDVLESNATANRFAVLLDRDLEVLEQELRLVTPRLALVTDVQDAAGGRDLVLRIPADQRARRCGVRFPRLAPSDMGRWPQVAADGVAWLCQQLLPALIYRVLRVATTAAREEEACWQSNRRVYQLLHGLQLRAGALLRVIQRGILPSVRREQNFGGVYFAATDPYETTGQAFLAGVMPQLLEMQNDAAWTEEARQHDARCRRLAWFGYALLVTLVTAIAIAAWRLP